jgi:hypothetical protein
MTATNTKEMVIRPTLIIGLGGAGSRIAVELKARLEEQLGAKSNYKQAIRFLCLDTASENFKAYHPTDSSKEVSLIMGEEFLRISDVPLQDLVRHKPNKAIERIMPETLHSTQIDQGAQQVRRLGRVALFHHYNRVKAALKDVISKLRDTSKPNPLGKLPDNTNLTVQLSDRLRVYVIGSVCGGTGSGTFIDIAYWCRYFSDNKADVYGMLMLPETFPEIITTGYQRIRANAYAALLDLEYYNQPITYINEADTTESALYHLKMDQDNILVYGRPFTNCYLFNDPTIRGINQYAPLMSEILQVMMTSRIGEQLDATLDNLRGYLNIYNEGYREFYSAINLSQLVQPKVWQRTRYARAVQQLWIERFFINKNPLNAKDINLQIAKEAERYFAAQTQAIKEEFSVSLARDVNTIIKPLSSLSFRNLAAAAADQLLQETFYTVQAEFERMIINELRIRTIEIGSTQTDELLQTIKKHVNAGLQSTETRGLAWTLEWLNALENQIKTSIKENGVPKTFQQQSMDELNQQRILTSPSTSRLFLNNTASNADKARNNLIRFFRRQAAADSDLIKAQINEIHQKLLISITDQKNRITTAISEWQRQLAEVTHNPPQTPNLAPRMQSVIIDTEAEAARLKNKAENLIRPPSSPQEDSAFQSTIDSLRKALFPGSSLDAEESSISADFYGACTDPARLKQLIERLETYSQSRYEDIANTTANTLYEHETASSQLIRDLAARAEKPLLEYKEGIVGSVRKIKVLGADTNERAEALAQKLGVEVADLSKVSTGAEDRIQLLVSHHGIPINAISKFDDYRRSYTDLSADVHNPASRYGIFHIDNHLETAPYDPGSESFIDVNDFDLCFIEALAYGWIAPNRSRVTITISNTERNYEPNKVFCYTDALYQAIKSIANQQINQYVDRHTECEDIYTSTTNTNQERLRAETEKKWLESKLNHLNTYFDVVEMNASTGNLILHEDNHKRLWVKCSDSAEWILLETPGGSAPDTLLAAYRALYNALSKRMQFLFVEACEKQSKESERKTLDKNIEEFLNQRQLSKPSTSSEQNGRWLSAASGIDDSRALEERLAKMLMVYYRVRRRNAHASRRKAIFLSTGYISDIDRDDKNGH